MRAWVSAESGCAALRVRGRARSRRATAQRVPSGHVLYARRHVVLNELQLGFQVLHRVARVALGAAATVQGVRAASTQRSETAATPLRRVPATRPWRARHCGGALTYRSLCPAMQDERLRPGWLRRRVRHQRHTQAAPTVSATAGETALAAGNVLRGGIASVTDRKRDAEMLTVPSFRILRAALASGCNARTCVCCDGRAAHRICHPRGQRCLWATFVAAPGGRRLLRRPRRRQVRPAGCVGPLHVSLAKANSQRGPEAQQRRKSSWPTHSRLPLPSCVPALWLHVNVTWATPEWSAALQLPAGARRGAGLRHVSRPWELTGHCVPPHRYPTCWRP